jgi:hypothetical protein
MAMTNRTMFAVQAVGLAEIFKHTIGKTRLEGMVNYRLELTAPEGESTAGGKQALQHVTLIPEGAGTRLVIATANTVTNIAQVRSFSCVAEAHRRRFKGALLLLDQQRYGGLVEKLSAFFKERGFQVSTVDALPDAAPARGASSRARLVACAAALTGIAIGVVIFALR